MLVSYYITHVKRVLSFFIKENDEIHNNIINMYLQAKILNYVTDIASMFCQLNSYVTKNNNKRNEIL